MHKKKKKRKKIIMIMPQQDQCAQACVTQKHVHRAGLAEACALKARALQPFTLGAGQQGRLQP